MNESIAKICQCGNPVRRQRTICKACINLRQRQRRRENPEYDINYAIKNKDKISLQKIDYHRRIKIETLNRYGKICACCGESEIEFLAIDHINGGGAKERREFGKSGGVNFYQVLKNKGYPDGYRVLCHNCNMALGAFGYCPHNRGMK